MYWIWIVISLSYFLHNVQVEGKKGFGPGEQEWGYVTVRPSAHIFWWLYYVNPPTESTTFNVFEKPLLIWLQGGPGASSTGYGNFEELGPLDVNLQNRNYTWVNDYNVLFIDNPVGTGFSYVDLQSAYTDNNRQIAEDLVECIRGFYNKIPQFKKVPVYITAESYGGKMAAEFALLWYQAQKNLTIDSNLKGVALGDSWISPIDSVLSWAPFLLHTGMIDTQGFETIQEAALLTKKAVDAKSWHEATKYWSYTENVILQVTENIDFYNILEETRPKSLRRYLPGVATVDIKANNDYLLDNLMNTKVKTALGLEKNWSMQSSNVFQTLSGDFMKPVTNIVERLLNETDLQIFIFTGQLDLIVATPGTLAWVENLNWQYIEAWKNTSRIALSVDNIIEGYIKEYKNLKMYWINRSGHMVPRDNPYATSKMLKDLTSAALK
ncbi:hypothetical protein PV325_004593 [Microctonus aethiopoides]|uniref:Carboxypeptidase n=1 Tax=Microctonus aethiopoides TaxID=144406 RepID=A0AA39FXD4_9HYME|nr:hypothetical protein PV325_004593 [Microctonus aethiopoides]KAK0091086.1 hypothetical protein PV326_003774 [Microctonus aethiopoides]KAK0177600.1 hypothetical protein PV328_001637 [Microctonus aethiopoides]